MKKGIVIYESRYGFTETVARKMAMILGPSKLCRVSQFSEDYKNFDFFIIGSPVYRDNMGKDIIKFVHNNLNWLKDKKIILFSTSISSKDGEVYLEELHKLLGKSVIISKSFGGHLDTSKLTEEDYEAARHFSKKTGAPFKNSDTFNLQDFVDSCIKIRHMIFDENTLKEDELRNTIEDYIKNHSCCCLATGHDKSVRSTPLEYVYDDGYIYILSEGGEKFANILINEKVSLSIYEPCTCMTNISGMQLTGTATLYDPYTNEYKDVIESNKFDYNFDQNNIILNLIKIKIDKVEFLNSAFGKCSEAIRQTIKL